MNQPSVKEKIIGGITYRLIETFGIVNDPVMPNNGVHFYKKERYIGHQRVIKVYNLVNEQYQLMYSINLHFNELTLDEFDRQWEHNWWPNSLGDY